MQYDIKLHNIESHANMFEGADSDKIEFTADQLPSIQPCAPKIN